ncbi:MAG TPA: glycosyltransferase family 39 protein, partial [Rhodanobacteraceae bacterium]|nr:glycosyltransferase family 39 protein [Rhodanobacteraceae bacterium]
MASHALMDVKRRPLLALICLGLLLGFAFQGSRGLWSTDEGRYVDGALQMLDSGNYLVPAYSPIEANLSKPPATYWAIAASIKLFGRNTWAARVPYALAFVLTIWLLYGMGRRLLPDKPWLPGLIYALSLAPFFGANVVSTDELLTLCEAFAMYGFVGWAFEPDDRPAPVFLVLMWVGWGAAFLTKGPPGLLPLLAIIPFVALRDGWRGIARLFSPLGIALFLVVGLGWFAVVVLRVPWALHYFLHRELYDRVFTSVQHRNPGAWGWLIVYLPTIVLGSLPWWPSLAPAFVPKLRRHTPMRSNRRADARLMLWLWFAIPLVVFCLAQSRLPLYVLPLFLPLSLLLAGGLVRRIDLHKSGQRLVLGIWIAALLAFKGGVAYAVHQPHLDNRFVARQLSASASSRT